MPHYWAVPPGRRGTGPGPRVLLAWDSPPCPDDGDIREASQLADTNIISNSAANLSLNEYRFDNAFEPQRPAMLSSAARAPACVGHGRLRLVVEHRPDPGDQMARVGRAGERRVKHTPPARVACRQVPDGPLPGPVARSRMARRPVPPQPSPGPGRSARPERTAGPDRNPQAGVCDANDWLVTAQSRPPRERM